MSVSTFYNNAGKLIIILDMPDAYLLNAYTKYRKNIEEIEKKLETNSHLWVFVAHRLEEMKEIRDALRKEVDNRNLFA